MVRLFHDDMDVRNILSRKIDSIKTGCIIKEVICESKEKSVRVFFNSKTYPPLLLNPDNERYLYGYPRKKKMRNYGILMAVTGALLTGISTPVYFNLSEKKGGLKAVIGMSSFIGLGVFFGSLPVMAMGSKKMKEYRSQYKGLD